ncbi:hypothetical protein QYB48_002760 [Clostridium perfringens]|nr:hypothetical protein [Clostridium perfringens]
MSDLIQLKDNIRKLRHCLRDDFDINTIELALESINLNKKVKNFTDAEKLICKIDLLKLFNINATTQERFICKFFKNELVFQERLSVKDLPNLSPKDAYDALETLGEQKVSEISKNHIILSHFAKDTSYHIAYIVPKDYEAYILHNSNGYRYYLNTTKNDRTKLVKNTKGSEKPSFTLINLIQIFYKLSFFEAINYICEKVGITIICKENEVKKIIKNNLLLTSGEFPEVYKLLDKHYYILELFFNRSIDLCFNDVRHENNLVFYYPVRKIKTDIFYLHHHATAHKRISLSYISSIVRVFNLLGLISIIDVETLSEDFKYNKIDNLHFDINAYCIPTLNKKILTRAEKIAKKINDNNLNIAKLNREKYQKALGKKYTDKLFKNSIIREDNKNSYEEKITAELIKRYEEYSGENIS